MHPTGSDRPPMVDPWLGKRKLLAVSDVQTGYHHDSISHTLATIERLGRDSGKFVTNIRTDSQLITKQPIVGQGTKYGGKPVNGRSLDAYDALFLLPSGAGTLSEQQKTDLLAFVHDDGKGLILGHAAILSFYEWPEFAALAGARLGGEFISRVTVHVDDIHFPGANAFGADTFEFHEQHCVLKEPYTRDNVHVVMRIDAASMDAATRSKRDDDDFPVIWTRQFGKGRVYHLGWGHMEATWDDPRFQAMVLGGIAWAMGAPPQP